MRLELLFRYLLAIARALALLLAMATFGIPWANAMMQVPMLRGNNQIYIPVMFFIPLLSATVIGVAAHSPFGDVERAVSRSLLKSRTGWGPSRA